MTLRVLMALMIVSNAVALDQNLLPKAKYADTGGRCLDGSMAGYYYGPPSSGKSSLWVVYMKGGGGCHDKASCEVWGQNMGSSTVWPSKFEPNVLVPSQHNFKGYPPFLDPNPSKNPDFHDAHHVYIPYCTGDGHSGQVVKPTSEQWGYYFSGHLNFKAILDELQATVPAAKQMSRVLFTGVSAGGIGTFMNCDYLQTYLDEADIGANVSCAPLAGWFYPGMAEDQSNPAYPPSTWPDWSQGKVTPSPSSSTNPWKRYLPTECTKDKPKEEESYCGSVHNVYPYVKAPMFVVENQYDSSQSKHLLFPQNQGHTAQGEGYLAYLGRAMRNSTHQVVKHPLGKVGDGLFSVSCWNHADFIKVKGFNYKDVLADWFFGRGKMPHILVDDCNMAPPGLPCNPECKTSYPPGPSPGPSPPAPPSPPGPLPPAPAKCEAAFKKACGDSMGKWSDCLNCAKDHMVQMGLAGCTSKDIRSLCHSSFIV